MPYRSLTFGNNTRLFDNWEAQKIYSDLFDDSFIEIVFTYDLLPIEEQIYYAVLMTDRIMNNIGYDVKDINDKTSIIT